jgi:hypothetical protein
MPRISRRTPQPDAPSSGRRLAFGSYTAARTKKSISSQAAENLLIPGKSGISDA